ncbi:MAG: hypothetical protein AAB500_02610 [Patescibacteria group bacterium]
MRKNRKTFDKKKLLREKDRLTRPPRMEGVVHRRGVTPIHKKKSK